ncbi:hypothetical protein P280DRAFT_410383 [Massarina eburnea CBS 473.64]|uniref:Large ribosomal subunit protein bL32m n=1 Tax=Massarina eburnea CBS 473.64 TaxID=1395130 RepID=A0A6A6RPF2_9PLEO|nr:hypothetical protein P280DRAFT_410383 [Massarina eburnea CBS 473.64]
MALAHPLPPLWRTLLPALYAPVRRPFLQLPLLQRLSLTTPFAALSIPALAIPSWSIPSLADIWEGILKAVPKKKTSHRKRRQRFMAGKGIQDITALNKCSACGRVKRAHILCPYCVDAIKTNIFGQVGQAIRQPTDKQRKQLKREAREESQRRLMSQDDPREEKPIIKHGDWRSSQ